MDDTAEQLSFEAALARFDGSPTAEVVDRLRAEEGLDVTPALLRRLYEFKVLQPPRA